MITQLATSTANRDLYSGAAILTATPSATDILLCQALVYLGSVAYPMNADGGIVTLTVTVGGQLVIPEFGATVDDARVAVWGSQFVVPANTQVVIHAYSDDLNDDGVDVTCVLYNVAATDTAVTTAISDLQTHGDTTWATADISGLATVEDINDLGSIINPIADDVLDINSRLPSDPADQSEVEGAISASEAAILAAMPIGAGSGAIEYDVIVQSGGAPLDGVEVIIRSGSTVVAGGYTNASGLVTFYLDAGTYDMYRNLSGYSFPNPVEIVVS